MIEERVARLEEVARAEYNFGEGHTLIDVLDVDVEDPTHLVAPVRLFDENTDDGKDPRGAYLLNMHVTFGDDGEVLDAYAESDAGMRYGERKVELPVEYSAPGM